MINRMPINPKTAENASINRYSSLRISFERIPVQIGLIYNKEFASVRSIYVLA